MPSTVGGNPQGLSRHLCLLGVESQSWALEQNYLNYPCDWVVWGERHGLLVRELRRWSAIVRAALRADVIHFNFGTSLAYPVVPSKAQERGLLRRLGRRLFATYTSVLQLLELRLYRLRRIPMFVHYQGDDARQGDYSLAHFDISIATQVEPGYYDPVSDRFKRNMIRRMAAACDQVYAVNPDLLHVLPASARFIPYCHIELDAWRPVYPADPASGPLRVGHAPSHRKVKGTELVIAEVEALQQEGHAIELVLVEGLSHAEAKTRYQSVDVLVDQLFAGWYGGLAVEAMALGKPVLVYLRDGDLRFIPPEMRAELPFIQVTPATLRDGLLQVLRMPRAELHALARRSRAFVERWHDPLKIAASIKADYELALRRRGKLAA